MASECPARVSGGRASGCAMRPEMRTPRTRSRLWCVSTTGRPVCSSRFPRTTTRRSSACGLGMWAPHRRQWRSGCVDAATTPGPAWKPAPSETASPPRSTTSNYEMGVYELRARAVDRPAMSAPSTDGRTGKLRNWLCHSVSRPGWRWGSRGESGLAGRTARGSIESSSLSAPEAATGGPFRSAGVLRARAGIRSAVDQLKYSNRRTFRPLDGDRSQRCARVGRDASPSGH